jgi:serine phosphatase RsbU (regulator of sigma subunit)
MKSTVIHLLRQDEGKNRDGMEVSICVWDKKRHIVEFAGANHSLIYIQNNELHQIKGDRATIGKDEFKHFNSFTKHEIAVTSDSEFYLFTDGYMDQFGGAENKKFMFGSFKELIFKNHLKQMNTQKQILEETLQDWQGEEEQVDDVLIFGFRLMD